jgi:hypothetical protein
LSNLFPFGRNGFCQQLGERLVETFDEELCLKMDGGREQIPQLSHFG